MQHSPSIRIYKGFTKVMRMMLLTFMISGAACLDFGTGQLKRYCSSSNSLLRVLRSTKLVLLIETFENLVRKAITTQKHRTITVNI